MSDAVHSHLLLTLARAVRPLVPEEHQKHIDAAVKDWPHAKAFIEDAKHDEGKAEADPNASGGHAGTTQRHVPPATRRSESTGM
jgi:hypothetical protein